LKPEVSFPAGNCDHAGEYMQTGVVSLDGNGHIAENVGTSFATPLAASVAGHVFHQLDVGGELVSSTMAKGLMIHSAFTRHSELDPEEIHYFGLRSPQSPLRMVQCIQSSTTVIIQAPIKPKPDFGKRPFPIPKCLNTGDGLQCEIFMTLLYDPPLDRQFGFEYCRCNVSASLGTFRNVKGKKTYKRAVEPVPTRNTSGYERDLVQHGFKWSPLKLYYRKFEDFPANQEWRLTFDLFNRAESALVEYQDVFLFITIRGLDENLPVYNQMVQEMTRLGWGAQDLKIRSRGRVRG